MDIPPIAPSRRLPIDDASTGPSRRNPAPDGGFRLTLSRRQLLLVLVTSLAYLACAVVALLITNAEDGIAAFWPASGVFVAGLILATPATRPWLTGGVAAASMASNVVGGVPWLEAVGYTLANIIEGLFVLWLLGDRRRARFADPATMIRFMLAAILGGFASALMAGILSANFTIPFLRSWATTVILGLATVTPIVMFIAQDSGRRVKLLTPQAFAAYALVASLSVAAFAQDVYPLLFLPVVGLSFATLLLGLAGSSIALGLVAAIGSWLTAAEQGPVGQDFPTIEAQVLYFQAYIVALIVSVMPLAVLLTRHQLDAEQNLELAQTDDLTGLATRRKILDQLIAAMRARRRPDEPLAIAMIDLDLFKRINDRFGHIIGDRILFSVTKVMRETLERDADLGRLGGEEFLALFDGKDMDRILARCEELRRRVEAYEWDDDGPEQVTLSIGVARFDPDLHLLPADLLRAADRALYRAKDEGRNRIALAEPIGGPKLDLTG